MQNHSITFSLSCPRMEAHCPHSHWASESAGEDSKSSPTTAEEALESHKIEQEGWGLVTPRVAPNGEKKEVSGERGVKGIGDGGKGCVEEAVA